MRRRALVASLALGISLSACEVPREEFHVPKITNLGEETIEVYVESHGVETRLALVEAGKTVGLFGFDYLCTREPMVARTLDREEVARRSEPICPDEFWAIEP